MRAGGRAGGYVDTWVGGDENFRRQGAKGKRALSNVYRHVFHTNPSSVVSSQGKLVSCQVGKVLSPHVSSCLG